MSHFVNRYRLSTVYGVFLMNFKDERLDGKFRTDTVVADRESGCTVNPHLRQIYLQFPYFEKELEECVTLYDKLIYVLKNMNKWNRMPDALKEQVFRRLEQLAAVANLSEDDRVAYDKAVDKLNVSLIVQEDKLNEGWKRGKEEGLQEGMKKGMQKGRKEGMQKGIQKGRKEGIQEGMQKATLDTARNLKRMGIPVETITKATGLSREEVDKLNEEQLNEE